MFSLLHFLSVTLLFACLSFASLPALASDTGPSTNPVAASLAPAERFEVASMLVERHGDKGSPLVLIPGLASGAWVWQDTVRQFKGDHVVYVVTLAGFDGRPAAEGNAMDNAQQAILALIASRKLAKPVLIGHSLGAIMSFAIAEQHPGLISGVVAIDGLPVFPGTEAMPLAQRPAMAQGVRMRMAGVTQEAFAAQQVQYMQRMGVIDAAKGAELAKLTAKSDPAATAQYMAEAIELDLRAGLPKITVPVLLIAPYNEPDQAARKITQAMMVEYYTSLVAGTPKVSVVPVSPSRHFAMFDQPKQVADAIGNYLKSLGTQ
jgi:pimeloyl-ACP methyl ester carboxylesterase